MHVVRFLLENPKIILEGDTNIFRLLIISVSDMQGSWVYLFSTARAPKKSPTYSARVETSSRPLLYISLTTNDVLLLNDGLFISVDPRYLNVETIHGPFRSDPAE